MHDGILYAVRDKFGFHPLVLGKKNGGYVVASESCALDMIQAKFVSDIEPGSIYQIDSSGYEKMIWAEDTRKIDIFEFIYFSRPDSFIHGVEVGLARQEAGKILARQHPARCQLVVSMPNSANEAALGYYNELCKNNFKLEFNPWALFRSHFVGRTFLEALSKNRKLLQRQKFNPRWSSFIGISEVVVIDDSLIRGTVMTGLRILFDHINQQLVLHGFNPVEKIHIRIASPPYIHPDYYGVDTYRRGETLIADVFNCDLEAMADHFGFASVRYLSLNGLIDGVLKAQEILRGNYFAKDSFYAGPFDGIYPDGIGCYQQMAA
jgi:amidophosphoribosyltransferase